VSQYQKGKTNLDFTEARDSEWQWHQLDYMQVCISLQTDNHASTSPLSFLQAGCPSCCPTNSVKALKANLLVQECIGFCLFSQCISSSLSSSSISFKIFIMFLFLLTATVGSISTSGVEMSNVSQPSRNGEFINKQEAGSVEVVMFV